MVWREVVMAQLVERSLSLPEVRGSTPVIGKILLNICLLTWLLSTVLKRWKKNKKRPGMAYFKKIDGVVGNEPWEAGWRA